MDTKINKNGRKNVEKTDKKDTDGQEFGTENLMRKREKSGPKASHGHTRAHSSVSFDKIGPKALSTHARIKKLKR